MISLFDLVLVGEPPGDETLVVGAAHVQNVHFAVEVCGVLELAQMALQCLG